MVMRTTIALDDDILALARQYADARSMALGKAVSELLRRGFTEKRATRAVNGLQVFDLPSDSPCVSSARVRELEAESD